jgi:hypothetical protein
LKSPNTSTAFMEHFVNVTLGITPVMGVIESVSGMAGGGTIWNYHSTTFWSIYSPALGSVLAIVLYGFYCIRRNGQTIDRTFSTLLIATRAEELDAMYAAVPDHDALMQVKLTHKKGGQFHIDDHRTEHS